MTVFQRWMAISAGDYHTGTKGCRWHRAKRGLGRMVWGGEGMRCFETAVLARVGRCSEWDDGEGKGCSRA